MAASPSDFLEQTAIPGDGIAARVLKGVETVLGVIAALILAVLLTVVLVSVCLRYFFDTGFIGA